MDSRLLRALSSMVSTFVGQEGLKIDARSSIVISLPPRSMRIGLGLVRFMLPTWCTSC